MRKAHSSVFRMGCRFSKYFFYVIRMLIPRNALFFHSKTWGNFYYCFGMIPKSWISYSFFESTASGMAWFWWWIKMFPLTEYGVKWFLSNERELYLTLAMYIVWPHYKRFLRFSHFHSIIALIRSVLLCMYVYADSWKKE